jgi:hypothetical protein
MTVTYPALPSAETYTNLHVIVQTSAITQDNQGKWPLDPVLAKPVARSLGGPPHALYLYNLAGEPVIQSHTLVSTLRSALMECQGTLDGGTGPASQPDRTAQSTLNSQPSASAQ